MDILLLPLTGVVVSLVVQVIKASTKQTLFGATVSPRVVVVVLSLVAGAGWYYLGDNEAFLTVVTQVFVYANTVWAFVITYFEDDFA